ncbi:MAG: RNA polymerase sigma factor [Thermomicrobiales bacterium]
MSEQHDSSQSPTDDDARIVALARVDPGAFALLYRRYVDTVYRYCVHRLGTREQAEDATSQIFLKALAALPSHRPGGSFRGWLFTIAHNVITDTYRARRTHWPLTDALEQPDHEPSPEEQAIGSIERDEVRAMLLMLPVDQRRIMELRLAGLTGTEIAEALGKNLGAVKMAQSRAIARLKQAMFAAGEPRDDREPCAGNEETLHAFS